MYSALIDTGEYSDSRKFPGGAESRAIALAWTKNDFRSIQSGVDCATVELRPERFGLHYNTADRG